jgi:hypothetical protein
MKVSWVPKWIRIVGVDKDLKVLVEDVQSSVANALRIAEADVKKRGAVVTANNGASLSYGDLAIINVPAPNKCPLLFPPPMDGMEIFVLRTAAGATVSMTCFGSNIDGGSTSSLPASVGMYHYKCGGGGWWRLL